MSTEKIFPVERAAMPLVRHPWVVAALAIAISIIACFGVQRLKFDASLELLMARNPATAAAQQTWLQVSREFGSDVRTYFLIREETWIEAKLKALGRLHDELSRLPAVERMEDVFSVVVVRGNDGQLTSSPLLHGPRPVQPGDFAELLETLRGREGQARFVRHLVSADGRSVVLGVSLREEMAAGEGADKSAGSVPRMLDAIAARFQEDFPSLVRVGPQQVEEAFRESMQHDLEWLGGSALFAILLVLLGVVQSLRAVLLAAALCLIALLWTFGAMGLLGVAVTLSSSAAAALVVAAGAIRVMRPMLQASAAEEIETTQILRLDGAALSAGTVIALGLATQLLAGVGAVDDLLASIALGFAGVGAAAALLMPLLAALLTRSPRTRAGISFAQAVAALSSGVVDRLNRHGAALALAALLALGGMLALLLVRGIQVEHSPLALLGEAHSVARSTQRLQDEIAGPGLFQIRLDAYAKGAFRDPANLQRLADIQAFIDKQTIFDGSVSLADYVLQAHQEVSGGRNVSIANLPANRRLIEQYLLLLHPESVSPYVSDDFSRAAIVVRHGIRDAALLSENVRELRAVVGQIAGPAMTTTVSGRELLVDESVLPVVRYSVLAGVLATLAVFAVLSLMFTSVFAGAIAAASSLASLLVALVATRLLEIPLSMLTSVGAMFPVMVSVLATVRLFSSYSDVSRRANSTESPVMAAVSREAGPIFAVFLTCIVASSCLFLSHFAALRHLGVFLCIAFASAAVIALCFVPVALSRMRLVSLYDILAMSGKGREVAASPLFSGFSSYQMRKMILLSELREFRDGACVIEQGALDNSMYLVLSGEVEVVRHADDGERHLATLAAGEVFGEIGFVRETYRTADVRAIGDVTVLRFDYQRLRHDLMLFPNIMAKLNFNICGILGKRLAETVEKPKA